MPYHLVPTPIQSGLDHAKQDISDGIDSGQIVGLGIIVMTKGRRFFVDAFGALLRDPHAGRGYVASLDDCLRVLGDAKMDTNTTR